MHRFFIKTPWWARTVFSSYVWRIPSNERVVYLTFDDGPHPTVTPWVLNELAKYDAKATFFCIGDNVVSHPETFQQLMAAGHSIGNHTQRHPNGWQTGTETYLSDVAAAAEHIRTNLFRPPYGRIKSAQAKGLAKAMRTEKASVIMWDVLSADFDTAMTPERCTKNVLENVEPGSIVVFHDSEKAFPNLGTVLPDVLKRLAERGYGFEKLDMEEG